MVLRISGQITGEDVDTVQAALKQEHEVVAIDLQEVLLVGGEAVKLLARSQVNGIKLKNPPAYIREWVLRERAQMQTERTE